MQRVPPYQSIYGNSKTRKKNTINNMLINRKKVPAYNNNSNQYYKLTDLK